MDELELLLDDLGARVRVADFAALSQLAPRIEAALNDLRKPIDDKMLQRLKAKAEQNASLLDAVRRGVRSARFRVDEVRRAAQNLQTYDVKGRRADIPPAGTTAGRF